MGSVDDLGHHATFVSTYLLRLVNSSPDASFFEVREVLISRIRGRKTGIHWTMMVPTISDEYQMLEWALRQKYHSSFWLPSSFQPVRMADITATTIP